MTHKLLLLYVTVPLHAELYYLDVEPVILNRIRRLHGRYSNAKGLTEAEEREHVWLSQWMKNQVPTDEDVYYTEESDLFFVVTGTLL